MRRLLLIGDSRVHRIGEDAESVGIIRITAFNVARPVVVLSAGLSALSAR